MFDRSGAPYLNHTGVRYLATPNLPEMHPDECRTWLDSDILDEVINDPAFQSIAKALACAKYLDLDLTDEAVIRNAIQTGRSRHGESGARGYRRRPKRGLHEPIVYYMARGDLVKIGLSTNIITRHSILGMPELLAIERGDIKVERARHKFFVDLHVQGEWFRNVDPLTAYVGAVAEAFNADFGTDLSTWFEDLKEWSRG